MDKNNLYEIWKLQYNLGINENAYCNHESFLEENENDFTGEDFGFVEFDENTEELTIKKDITSKINK
ncbi:hypothetical protein GW932_03790 [archaeon]|nr:hypothetical protein [archaeon]